MDSKEDTDPASLQMKHSHVLPLKIGPVLEVKVCYHQGRYCADIKIKSIPLKHVDVTRTTCMSLDVLLEKQIEHNWNVDGERELSYAWTGFTRFILLRDWPREGYTWSGRWCMAIYVEVYVQCSEKKAKQRWVIVKPKLDNARQLRGISFIEPYDEEFKLTFEAARRKLEVPMPVATPFAKKR